MPGSVKCLAFVVCEKSNEKEQLAVSHQGLLKG